MRLLVGTMCNMCCLRVAWEEGVVTGVRDRLLSIFARFCCCDLFLRKQFCECAH